MSLVKRMTESLNENSYVRDNDSFTMSYLSMIEKELDKYDFPTYGVDPDGIESTKYYDNFGRTRVLANIQIDPESEVIFTYIEIGKNNTVLDNEFNLSEIEEALNWCELNAKKYVKKRMTESLNNSTLNEDVNDLYKKEKKLHEGFDFEEENKDLYNKFVEIAERSGFEVTGSGTNYIRFEASYDDYILDVDIDVDDSEDDIEVTFESYVYLPSGFDCGSEDGFNSLEAAIAWGEEYIDSRVQLLRRIKKLINDSDIKDITVDELESLTD